MENKWKNKNFKEALKNSLNGIKYTFINGKNFKIQLVIAIIAIIAGIIFKISFFEWSIITILVFLVLFAEMINTVVETVVNMITNEYNENAKIAKDISAGAVTLCALCSVIVGLIIFIPKLLELIK